MPARGKVDHDVAMSQNASDNDYIANGDDDECDDDDDETPTCMPP